MKFACAISFLLAGSAVALQLTQPAFVQAPVSELTTDSINFALVGCKAPPVGGHPMNNLFQTAPGVLSFANFGQEQEARQRALHWALHWGCVSACGPEPVNSMCVTECEVDMYQCIDGAGPGDTQADIDKCQSLILAQVAKENGVEMQKKKGKWSQKKVEKKKVVKEGSDKDLIRDDRPAVTPLKQEPAKAKPAKATPAPAPVKKVVKVVKSIVRSKSSFGGNNTFGHEKEMQRITEQKAWGKEVVKAVKTKANATAKHIAKKEVKHASFGKKNKKKVVKSYPLKKKPVKKVAEPMPPKEEVEKSFGPLPPLKKFMPTCIAHLRQLVHMVDHSYTDIHLQTVLENECLLEKDFSNSCDTGFEKLKHCRAFAAQIHDARMLELKTGSLKGYEEVCRDYWNLRMGIGAEKPKSLHASAPNTLFDNFSAPKVSTTMHCIMALTFQYFALYTILAIVRTLVSFNYNLVGFQKIIETACTTVTYAPMLCVLFLGARMRAIQLSQGETEKFDLPQPWVQTSMFLASTAVLAQVLLVVLVGILSGMSNVRTDEEGNLDVSRMPDGHPLTVKLLTVARYLVMAMLYGGFAAVVIGIFTMEAPEEVWGNQKVPVSPAVMCTILLSAVFFTVYLLVAMVKTAFEVSVDLRSSALLLRLEAGATSAKMTVNLAPMLCILFIGARMRALQIDPKNGNPQSWAQKCFFMCTFSVLMQALLCVILPLVGKGECKRGMVEGDVSFSMASPILGNIMTVVRYVCLVGLYGGIITVVYSVFVIQHPEGPSKTPPVSPAMQCVINLAVQYFLIYSLLFICATVKTAALGRSAPGSDSEQAMQFQADSSVVNAMTRAIFILDAARATVMFAPMLAILFIGARMRALQLSVKADGTIPTNAGPQRWVQDGMYLATWAVAVQLFMTMLVPLLTGSRPECDQDGNVKVPVGVNKYLAIVAEVIRYACLIAMYGGTIVIVVGVFVMTPESLQKTEPLVPGVTVAKPPLPASYSFEQSLPWF